MKALKQITTIALAAVAASSLLTATPAQAATYLVKSETYYSRSGSNWEQDSKTTYTYDKKGREISRKNTWRDWVRYDESKQKDIYKNKTEEYKHTYDSKGRQIKYVRLTDGKEAYRAVTTYTSGSSTTKYWENGKYTDKYVSSYNKSGRWTGGKFYNSKNKLISTITATYDKKGYIIKQVEKNAKGKVTATYTWKNTYKNGKLVKCVMAGPSYKAVSTYYSNGMDKTWKYTSDDGYVDETRYDSKGNLTYSSYTSKNYSSATTYKNGWAVKEVSKHTSTDADGKKQTSSSTYTFKYKKSSGRVTEQIRYDENNAAVAKVVYTYTKI